MNPQAMQQMMARIGAAKPLNNRGEYIKFVGRHTVGILSYEYKEPSGEKKILATDLVVLESIPAVAGGPAYTPGQRLSAHWRMAGLDEWKAGKEMARAQAFVVSTLDAQAHVAYLNTLPPVIDPVTGQPKSQGQKWIEDEGFKGIQPDQPFRGRVVVINAHVHTPKSKPGQPAPQQTDKDPFVVVDWLPAPSSANSPEAIAARRAQYDQQFGAFVPFSAQAAAATAAPSYGHATQAAPMPTQYPPPPGYAAPAQYAPQYQQVPAPAPAQPQYPPQGYPPGVPPQGYAPGYPQPVAAPAPVPGVQPTGTVPGYPLPQGR
jgi:hypothetical protein